MPLPLLLPLPIVSPQDASKAAPVLLQMLGDLERVTAARFLGEQGEGWACGVPFASLACASTPPPAALPPAVGLDLWPLSIRDMKRHLLQSEGYGGGGGGDAGSVVTTGEDVHSSASVGSGGHAEAAAAAGGRPAPVAGVRHMRPGMFSAFLTVLVPRELRALLHGAFYDGEGSGVGCV